MIEEVVIDGKKYFKASQSYWNEKTSKVAGVVMRVMQKSEDDGAADFELMHACGRYVDRCVQMGVAKTDKDMDACARRYLAGKRKVSAPFTKTRKRAAIKVRKAKESVPKEVLDQIDYVMTLPIAQNVTEKSINALVGMVLKKHKYNPQVVKELIGERLAKIVKAG